MKISLAAQKVLLQLEQDRKRYSDTMKQIPLQSWHNKCANDIWTIEEKMSHIAANLEQVSHVISDIRKKRGFTNIPSWITTVLTFIFVRYAMREITKKEVETRYTHAHKRVLRILPTIKDAEWNKGQVFFGTYMTIQGIFQSYQQNFESHIHIVQISLLNKK